MYTWWLQPGTGCSVSVSCNSATALKSWWYQSMVGSNFGRLFSLSTEHSIGLKLSNSSPMIPWTKVSSYETAATLHAWSVPQFSRVTRWLPKFGSCCTVSFGVGLTYWLPSFGPSFTCVVIREERQGNFKSTFLCTNSSILVALLFTFCVVFVVFLK